MIKLHNLIVFLSAVIPYGLPPWRWGEAWRAAEEEHLAQIRKGIWELKKQGRIYEDKDGYLWPKK